MTRLLPSIWQELPSHAIDYGRPFTYKDRLISIGG